MNKAVAAVTQEGLSIREAALQFGVPKSTLGDRISGRVLSGATSGPDTYLDRSEEEELVKFLLRCAEIGYTKSRKQVLALVKRLLQKKGKCGTVTSGWWGSFCERHPNLTLRAPASLSRARAVASDPDVLDRYFDLLHEVLEKNNLLDQACQIFNMDETGMPLASPHVKIVTRKGDRNPVAPSSGDKSQITVVACVSAAGSFMPPMVILDRKTLPPRFTEGEISGTGYGLSAKGWIDQELFDGWFTDHFLKYAPVIRPLLLLLDGHSSHYCPDTIRLAAKEKVIIFALPPNTTHITQPLDKGCFGPLKTYWKEECHNYMTENPSKVMSRYVFSKLLSKAWTNAMTIRNITGGFKVCGICPFDRAALKVPLTKRHEQMEKLAEKSGLAYIPLFSPAKPPSHDGAISRKRYRRSLSLNDMYSSRHHGSSRVCDCGYECRCRDFSPNCGHRSSPLHSRGSSSSHFSSRGSSPERGRLPRRGVSSKRGHLPRHGSSSPELPHHGVPERGHLPRRGASHARGRLPRHGTSPARGRLPRHGASPARGRLPRRGASPACGRLPRRGTSPARGRLPRRGASPKHGDLPHHGSSSPTRGRRGSTSPERNHLPHHGASPKRGHLPRRGASPKHGCRGTSAKHRGTSAKHGHLSCRGSSPEHGRFSHRGSSPERGRLSHRFSHRFSSSPERGRLSHRGSSSPERGRLYHRGSSSPERGRLSHRGSSSPERGRLSRHGSFSPERGRLSRHGSNHTFQHHDRSSYHSRRDAHMLDAHCGILSSLLTVPEQEKSKLPQPKKGHGRVLTSVENIRMIEEKEREKQEKARLKEERKRELARKREEKAKLAVERKARMEAKKMEKAKIHQEKNRKVTKVKQKVTRDKVEHCPQFTEKELQLFETRFENGYDLTTDERYNAWLKTKSIDLPPAHTSLNELDDPPYSYTFDESVFDLSLGTYMCR